MSEEKCKKGKGKKIAIGIFTVLVIVVATVAVLLSRSSADVRTWTGLTMEELVYHLNTSLEGEMIRI